MNAKYKLLCENVIDVPTRITKKTTSKTLIDFGITQYPIEDVPAGVLTFDI